MKKIARQKVAPQKEEHFNAKTAREIREAIKDIKAGRNLSPAFSTVAEMRAYLEKKYNI